MESKINKKHLYITIGILIIIVALCFSFVYIYNYGGFNSFGEFIAWFNRKIRFVRFKLFHI